MTAEEAIDAIGKRTVVVFDHRERTKSGGYRDHGAVDHRHHVSEPPPPKGPGPRPVNLPE